LTILAALTVVLVMSPMPGFAQQGSSESGVISLRADNTSVAEIMEILAEHSGLNIVTGPTVAAKRISIRLNNTPYEEALNLIVRAAGLGYEHVGETILVTDMQLLASPTGHVTRVFDVQYASPGRLRNALRVISENVSVDSTSSKLIMHDTQFKCEQAYNVVRNLDTKPQQVLLEARLIEVNTSELEEIGLDWEKISKISSVFTEGYQGLSSKGAAPGELDYTTYDDPQKVYRQMQTLEIALEGLITDNHARLLSNAKIVTGDGIPAEIFAGETVPVIITSLQSAGGTGGALQSVQLEKIDVGVRLNITPRISSDGYITTYIVPEVSRILGFVGPDNDLPQTSTRRANTVVRVKDGHKIYLGGLLSEEKRKVIKRVPLLSSIPYLGRLFRHERTEKVNLDLLIEVTPHLIQDDGSFRPADVIEALN
jgi:type IV pilus assembly protein PilQ